MERRSGTTADGIDRRGASDDRAKHGIIQGLIALLVVSLLAACSSKGPEPDPTTIEPTGIPPQGSLLAEIPTQDNLEPRFTTLGADGSVNEVAISFSRPVVTAQQIGQDASALIDFEWQPDVAGTWTFTDAATAIFRPLPAFSAETEYKGFLRSVDTVVGALKPPPAEVPAGVDGSSWSLSFTTPTADFSRLVLQSFDADRKLAEVTLLFRGAIDPKPIARRLSWSIVDAEGRVRERDRPRVQVLSDDITSELKLRLSGEAIVASRSIRVAFREEGASTRQSVSEVALPGAVPFEIKAAYLAEGPAGFHVEVVCDDKAVEGERWYWDQPTSQSWYVSSRCELARSSMDKVVIEPPVKTQIVASSGGFRILGDFGRGAYRVRLEAGAKTVDGGVSRKTTEVDVRVPARSPQLAFGAQGRYLTRTAWQSLELRHLNLGEATVTVRHVPTENLAFWLGTGTEGTDETNSQLISKSKIKLEGELDHFATTPLAVDRSVAAETKGLLEVEVSGGDQRATSRVLLTDMMLIAKRTGISQAGAVSDREWGSGVSAWVLDADELDGLAGVTVSVLRRNGQVMGTCRTDRDGGCTVDLSQELDPSPPFAVIARNLTDFTYIAFDELRADVEQARVAGLPYARGENEASYSAALFTERGVYRPGETAHIAAVLRQRDGRGLSQTLPVSLKLIDPRGKLMRERRLETNSAGFVTDDVSFGDFATTGRYEAVLEVAKKVVARERFQVEEFVPERLEVQVSPTRDNVLAQAAVQAQVDARYLFGGTPAGARVQLGCELQPVRFVPDQNAELTFGPWQDEASTARPLQLGDVSAELDQDGVAQLQCPTAGAAGALEGTARAVLRAAVSEAGSGRATVGRADVVVHPAPFYIGLESGADEVGVGDTIQVRGAVVDWTGGVATSAPGADRVKLELVRLERQWGRFYDPSVGRDVYRSYRRPVVEEERLVRVNDGRFEAEFEVTRSSSGYLVRGSEQSVDASGQTASQLTTGELFIESDDRYYYWSPRESQQDVTPRPGRARWIALELPDEVEISQRFDVHFQAPFKGKALLTIETDQLLVSEWRDVQAGDNTWRTRLGSRDLQQHHDSGFVPNVYVSALVVKDPHLESEEAFLPDRALGVASVRVLASDYTQSIAMTAPSEVRSNSPLTVTVDLGSAPRAAGPRFATVAAVDEGILSLTDFATPDPLSEIFPARALGVETFETVGWTMAQLLDPTSSTGGDQARSGGSRVAPVKPVSLWSGLREVPGDGKLEVTFNVPEYRGALRVMAVTAGRERVSSDDLRVLVRDPLVLQTTLPRFLVKGDAVEVPAFVTNLSGASREVEIALSVEPLSRGSNDASAAVEILGPAKATVLIDQDKGAPVRFLLRSNTSSGAIRLRVRASSGDLVSNETLDVPLQAAGPRVRRTERVAVGGREAPLRLEDRLKGWEPGSETTTFWLARNRFADVYEHMDHLVRYPYGCLEQTTSSTRPLLSLSELLPLVALDEKLGSAAVPNVDALVQRGVDRIFSMQTSEGGFGYWPGNSQPAYWASAYATDFLLDAASEGYEVPQERLDQVLDWTEREVALANGERLRDGYSDNGIAFMHYVLAKAERGKQGLIRKELDELERRLALVRSRAPSANQPRYRNFSEGQYLEERFLLRAALYLTGDHQFENDLRSPADTEVEAPRNYGWSFYSDRRRRGLMLSVAVDLFGNDGAALGTNPLEPLAQRVASALRGQSRSYTTQDLVWGLNGLSKYSRSESGIAEASGTDLAPELWVDGARVAPTIAQQSEEDGEAGQANNWSWNVPRASESSAVELRVPGLGTDETLYLQVSSFGVRSGDDQPGPGNQGVALTRRFRRSDGALFDPSSQQVGLGEVITVELRLENRTGEQLTNLALVDRVAAGIEIENARLGRGGDGTAMPWLDRDALWQVDHLEIRDDRIEAFGPLGPRQSVTLVYGARATAAGVFTLPMPAVEAMYNPEVWARAAGSALTVER